jgi:hypothetical protein
MSMFCYKNVRILNILGFISIIGIILDELEMSWHGNIWHGTFIRSHIRKVTRVTLDTI